jgi:hypothetical protein
MKREVFFFIIFFIIFISNIINVNAANITGDAISGKMTVALGMNITIIAVPTLEILSPENGTYLTNNNLLLNYSASSDVIYVWYSLDGGGNITINSSILFNASEGAHSLSLYANNSQGYTREMISFAVNTTLFTILRSEYNGTTKGASTDFIVYTYEKLQNLSNITLENTISGKILFNQNINITDDENFNDYILDLDNNTDISFNRIELNSTALPNFNVSATLSLYGLTFTNPRILKDGSVCSATICTKENYSGGILKFNVTDFTVYSSEETPVGVIPPPPGGGGGGGGVISRKGFILSEDEIKVKLKQGTFLTKQVVITNLENKNLNFILNVSRVDNLIKLSEYTFTLKPKEIKVITLDILAREDVIPDLYIGEIIFKTDDGLQKNILTAVEIESASPLFDVKVEIPQKFLYVMPGEEVYAKIDLYNLGEIEKEVDVSMEYRILDWKGNEILRQQETIAVNTKISYIKTFRIPEDVQFGRYAIYVRASYNERLASASAWFNVGKKPLIPWDWIVIVLLILSIIITIIIIIIKIRKHKRFWGALWKRKKKLPQRDYELERRLSKIRGIREKLGGV